MVQAQAPNTPPPSPTTLLQLGLYLAIFLMLGQFKLHKGLGIVMQGQGSRMIRAKRVNNVSITIAVNHTSSVTKWIVKNVNIRTDTLKQKTNKWMDYSTQIRFLLILLSLKIFFPLTLLSLGIIFAGGQYRPHYFFCKYFLIQ